MDTIGREKRDVAIMRDVRVGKDIRVVAAKYNLTYTRVRQIANQAAKQRHRPRKRAR